MIALICLLSGCVLLVSGVLLLMGAVWTSSGPLFFKLVATTMVLAFVVFFGSLIAETINAGKSR